MGVKSLTLRRVYVAVERAQSLRSHPTNQLYLFTAITDPLYLLDLERSQKVDLGTCRSQGPIRSLRLEGKGLPYAQIGV